MCTWPGRTKAYSGTALCVGLSHPSTTRQRVPGNTNIGGLCPSDAGRHTHAVTSRIHGSVDPRAAEGLVSTGSTPGFNGFRERRSFVRFSLWDSILVASLHRCVHCATISLPLSLSLSFSLSLATSQRLREIVRTARARWSTSLAIGRLTPISRY